MLTLYQVLSGWGKTLHFKWRERLGIEPGKPITITGFTGQRDHIVTNLTSRNKFLHPLNLLHLHFFYKEMENKKPHKMGLDANYFFLFFVEIILKADLRPVFLMAPSVL